MVMSFEIPNGRNLGSDIIGNLNVSTALYHTWIDARGGWVPCYETILFILTLKKKERKGIKTMYGHRSETWAIAAHARICKILTYLQERKEVQNELRL